MLYHEAEPPTELRAAIQGLWYLRVNFDDLPTGFEILPDGYVEIIFYFGSPCSVAAPDGTRQPLPSPFLMGLLNQPVVLHAAGEVAIIGLHCFPWAVGGLLGLPAQPGGARRLAHPIAQLQAPLAGLLQAGSIAEALALVSDCFLAARRPMAPDRLLDKAGTAMRAANGTLPVTEVAAAAHATVRTLERRFKQAAGYTVKDVSGLMRFEQARDHLMQHPDAHLASLAHDLGYADQAHLNREFRRYSGTTPAAFARKARRGQASDATDFVAFVQG